LLAEEDARLFQFLRWWALGGCTAGGP
jgi:hypothetical protein